MPNRANALNQISEHVIEAVGIGQLGANLLASAARIAIVPSKLAYVFQRLRLAGIEDAVASAVRGELPLRARRQSEFVEMSGGCRAAPEIARRRFLSNVAQVRICREAYSLVSNQRPVRRIGSIWMPVAGRNVDGAFGLNTSPAC